MQCQACGDESRQEVICRIDRPAKAIDGGHTLFCCTICGHVYGVLEAPQRKTNHRTGQGRVAMSVASPHSAGN